MSHSLEQVDEAIRATLDAHGGLGRSVTELDVESNLFDAGLTSFATVNLMLGLEDAFDVEFPEHLLNRTTFSSIGQIRAALMQFVDVDDDELAPKSS